MPFSRSLLWIVAPLVLFAALLAASAGAAEEKEEVPMGWTQSLVGGLSFTQTDFENYAQGGESSLTWTALATYLARQHTERRDWKTEMEAQFGQTRLGDGDLRKAVDRIKLTSVHTWTLGEFVDPYLSVDAQTQFAKGYNYPDADTEVEVSRFANPLYFNQAFGVGKQIAPGLRTRLGGALHEVFVTDEAFAAVVDAEHGIELRYTDDPTTDKLEKTRLDTGLESVTEYEQSFREDHLQVKSQLKLFSQFDDPATMDVFWNTKFTANVFSFLNVILETELIYDEDIVKRTQFKEVLSIGLTHRFF